MVPVTIDPTPDAPFRGSETRLLLRLAAAVSGAVLMSAAATAILIIVVHRRDWWSGWAAALVVSLAAALLALGPLAAGLFINPQTMAYGYLAGAFVRMLVSISGALAAVWVLRTPPAPTLLLMLPLFFAGLVAECFGLGRALGRRKV
jgi:hypothetical protein